MNSILSIVATYLAAFTFGSMALVPFFNKPILGKSWAQFYYGLIMVFFTLFLGVLYRMSDLHSNQFGIYLLALWVWGLSFTKSNEKTELFLQYLLGGVGFLWGLVYFKKAVMTHDVWLNATPVLVGYVIMSLFLSGTLMTLIFGHWYLVNRSLPILYLIKATKYLFGLTLIKIAASLIPVYIAYSTLPSFEWEKITSFMGHGIFFWSRLLAGLGIPLLVSVLSYQSAKIGSNQSATGILYAGSVFVLMGEFLSLYLFSITGYLI